MDFPQSVLGAEADFLNQYGSVKGYAVLKTINTGGFIHSDGRSGRDFRMG